METLKFLLQGKKADADKPSEIVSESVAWMEGQLQNAGIPFQFLQGGAGHGTYGFFQIKSQLQDGIVLDLKIAEINSTPYVAAEVRISSQPDALRFPYFGEIGSEHGRDTVLHFIADFVLSTMPELAGV